LRHATVISRVTHSSWCVTNWIDFAVNCSVL